MNINDITIGEAKKLAALFCSQSTTDSEDMGIQIVVLDRGFVYVGEVTADAEWIHIRGAKNIRVWGTSKGLGELVSGPLSATKLDFTGNVRAPRKALIALIGVEEKAWKKELSL